MALPSINSSTKFKEWITIINSMISQLKTATQAEAGLLSAQDKKKLDSISEGASSVDVEQLSMGVLGNSQVTLISGNTENMNEVSFVAGNGISLSQKVESTDTATSLKITINGSTFTKATPATEYDDGDLGLIQATAGNPNRMLFSDMQWKEAVGFVSEGETYPVTSDAVFTALKEKTAIYHASTDTLHGLATDTLYGHIKLTDSASEDGVNSGLAITPKGLLLVQRVAEEANLRSKQNEADIMKAEQKLSTAYRYKGSVYSYDSLPTEGNEIGDVYNVMFPNGTDGANYAWNGNSWDSQSGIFAVDSMPVSGSVNPVSSDGVYNALEQKAPVYHAFEIPEPVYPELPENPEEDLPETVEENPVVYVNYGVGSSTLYGHVCLTDDYMSVSKNADSGVGASAFAVYSIYNQLVEVKATADRTKDWTLFTDLAEAVYPSVEGDENILATKVVVSQINEKLDETNTALEEFKTAIGEQIEEIEVEHSTDVEALTQSLDTQVKAITDDIALVRQEMTEGTETILAEVDSAFEEQKKEFDAVIGSLEESLGKQIADNKDACDKAFDEINLTLNEQIENVSNLEQTILQSQESYEARFEEVNKSIEEVASGVSKTVVEVDGTMENVLFDSSAEANVLNCFTGATYSLSIEAPKAITSTFYVVFRNGYNASFVWPSSVKFSNDMECEMSSGVDILRFFTIDRGETWYIIHEFSSADA